MWLLEEDTLPKEVRTFVEDLYDNCIDHNVKMILKQSNYINMLGTKVNGYFSDQERVLAVAMGNKRKPIEQWLSILVHESCHMDQYVEQCKVWTQKIRSLDPSHALDLWMTEFIELKPKPLHQIIMAILNIELDCEMRAAKKIRKWNLPIDVKEYVQKANSYVYFYHMVAQRREWYYIGGEPYNIPEVWQAMPTHFDNDYNELPAAYKKLYVKHCFTGQPR